MLLPGPLLWLGYSYLIDAYPDFSLSLFPEKVNVAIITATFSFTMMGFLAAVITILYTFSGSNNFKRYAQKGHLDNFFFVYFLAILTLCFAFGVSLLSLGQKESTWLLKFGVALTTNSLIQTAFLTIIIVNVARHAILESRRG